MLSDYKYHRRGQIKGAGLDEDVVHNVSGRMDYEKTAGNISTTDAENKLSFHSNLASPS